MTRPFLFASVFAACSGATLGFFAGSGDPIPAPKAPDSLVTATPPTGAAHLASASPANAAPEPTTRTFRDATEAAQTLHSLLDQPDPRKQSREMHLLCAALDVPGLKVLLAAMEQEGTHSVFERGFASDLMARWAELDPRSAADYAVGLDARSRVASIYAVLGAWAVNDLAAAKEWALHTRDRQAHLYGLNAVVGFIAEKDPRAALALLDELPPAEDKSLYISNVFRNLAQKNPAQAAELAAHLATRALRQAAVREVASAWAEKEPGQALAWYRANTSSQEQDWQLDSAVGKILKAWTRTAPEEAAAFAGGLPPGNARTAMIGKLSAGWGAVDPEAAATWLQALPKSSESYQAFDSLVTSWTKSDPAGAGDFILAQPADRSRDWLLNTLGRNWADENPTAALAWAQQEADPMIERQVGAEAIGVLAAKDLPHAESYLDQMKTPEARKNAVRAVSYALTRREPERAAKWVMEMASNQDVGNAIEWPVRSWTWRDSDAVGVWLNQQPPGAQRDAAVGSYASALVQRHSPADAAEWASTIVDENLRQRRVLEIVGAWSAKDKTAARSWVTKQIFAPETKQALLEAVK